MIDNVFRGSKEHDRHGGRTIVVAEMVAQVQKMVEESGNPQGFDAKVWLDDWLTRPLPALGGDCAGNWLDTADRRAVIFTILACTQSGTYL